MFLLLISPKWQYSQRVIAWHPRLIMAEKSGSKHLANPHDIFATYKVYWLAHTSAKTSKIERPELKLDATHIATPPRYRMRYEIILPSIDQSYSYCILYQRYKPWDVLTPFSLPNLQKTLSKEGARPQRRIWWEVLQSMKWLDSFCSNHQTS